MRWLLDTNAVSRYLADKDVALTQKIKSKTTREVCICSIVKAELLYGAWNSNRIVEKLAELKQVFEDLSSFDFDDAAAGEFGKLQAYLSQQGCRIGPQ
jgi:tRNA(fMet)-specific endonuclease VapC